MKTIVIILCLFFIVFFVFVKIRQKVIAKRNKKLLESVTNSNRGTPTERDLVLKLLKSGIPPQTIFHDLYLKKYNDNFSQIDLVIATKVGIIVFEVKNYSGWIFGNGHHQQWTQVLAYGREKYRFYNPILQNRKHIEDLKKLKQFENIPFFSVIAFYGDCTLKEISFVPNETFIVKSKRILEVLKIILENNEPVQYNNKRDVVNVLKSAVRNGENSTVEIKHVENIKNMLGKHRVFD